eukprot:8786-Heterococcus_DN1.PRE.4
MSFFEVQCASDSSSSASDPSSRPGSPDTTNGEDSFQETAAENALPVSIANNLSTSNAVQDLEIYQRTTCLRDWQMYNRLSVNGNCTLTPNPEDEMLLAAVYAHIIQAKAEETTVAAAVAAATAASPFDPFGHGRFVGQHSGLSNTMTHEMLQ